MNIEEIIKETPIIGFLNLPDYYEKIKKNKELSKIEKAIYKGYQTIKHTSYLIIIGGILGYMSPEKTEIKTTTTDKYIITQKPNTEIKKTNIELYEHHEINKEKYIEP
jgi:hypothetical protein